MWDDLPIWFHTKSNNGGFPFSRHTKKCGERLSVNKASIKLCPSHKPRSLCSILKCCAKKDSVLFIIWNWFYKTFINIGPNKNIWEWPWHILEYSKYLWIFLNIHITYRVPIIIFFHTWYPKSTLIEWLAIIKAPWRPFIENKIAFSCHQWLRLALFKLCVKQ